MSQNNNCITFWAERFQSLLTELRVLRYQSSHMHVQLDIFEHVSAKNKTSDLESDANRSAPNHGCPLDVPNHSVFPLIF
jgi:hypothetical protein